MQRNLNMRSASRALVAAMAVGGIGFGVHSYASTGTKLKVSSSAPVTCTASTRPVSFGVYTPATAIAPATPTRNSDGRITVSCTGGGIHPTIFLGAGENGAGAGVAVTRAMKSTKSPADTLSYQLYQPAGFTSVWGTEAGPEGVAPAFGSVYSYTVNAQIIGGLTDSKAHTDYTDVVVATVTF